MFFFIFFDISSLLLRYITPAIPRSSRLDLSKNILKNIDSYLNFRTLAPVAGLAGFHLTFWIWVDPKDLNALINTLSPD